MNTSLEHIEFNWVKQWATLSPQRVAIQDGASERRYTYRDLYEKSSGLATQLRAQYLIEKGDRIACLAQNELEHVVLFFACLELGAVLVPLNYRLAPPELKTILRDCEPALLFIHSQFFSILSQITEIAEGTDPSASAQISCVGFDLPITATTDQPITAQTNADETSLVNLVNSPLNTAEILQIAALEPRSDHPHELDPCLILYTSGTTGKPKGVVISLKMIFYNSLNATLRLDLSSQDVSLGFLPFFHTGAWNVLLLPLLHRGGRIVLLKQFDAETAMHLCEQESVSILFGVPTTLEMLSRTPQFASSNLKGLRFVIVGGEAMSLGLIEKYEARGIPVRQGYGLTEFGPNVFSLNAEHSKQKIGSIGFANFYVNAKLVDASGSEVIGCGEGELALNGPVCMTGYWKNPDETAKVLSGGWLLTGDLLRRDEDGFYFVIGRKKEMYISGGENVYPAEVEQVLKRAPGVRDAAVIGVPDSKWGETGKAFVVLEKGAVTDEQTLVQVCLKNLAKYKIPKSFCFVTDLPRGENGKLLRSKLTS